MMSRSFARGVEGSVLRSDSEAFELLHVAPGIPGIEPGSNEQIHRLSGANFNWGVHKQAMCGDKRIGLIARNIGEPLETLARRDDVDQVSRELRVRFAR